MGSLGDPVKVVWSCRCEAEFNPIQSLWPLSVLRQCWMV